MWLEKSVMFPNLHATIRAVLASTPSTIVQFVLEPLDLPLILADFLSLGENYAQQLSYLTRTFAFYMHRKYQKLLKLLNDPPENLNNPNEPSISVLPASCDVSVHTIPCHPQHLSPTRDALPLLQPGSDYGGAPPSTSNTCHNQCNTRGQGTRHVQYGTRADIVQHNRVISPSVLPVLHQLPAAHHAPDVHELHPGYVPVVGGGVREEARKCLTMANITY